MKQIDGNFLNLYKFPSTHSDDHSLLCKHYIQDNVHTAVVAILYIDHRIDIDALFPVFRDQESHDPNKFPSTKGK